MIEKAVLFGPAPGLVGVISEPGRTVSGTSPIVIILNSGLLHKVGPFRLSVDIARTLQRLGYIVLRMDISGIGDSKMRLQKAGEDSAVNDVKYAMDYLSDCYGVNRFVLMGLCSGSDNSHRTAVADVRVVGAVHLDGYGFRNFKYYLYYYMRRLFSLRLVKQKLANLFTKDARLIGSYDGDAIPRTFPSISRVRDEFGKLIRRKVKLLYVYTRGVEYYYNYKKQLKDNLSLPGFAGSIELELNSMDDHTYSRTAARRKVVERIARWMEDHFRVEK